MVEEEKVKEAEVILPKLNPNNAIFTAKDFNHTVGVVAPPLLLQAGLARVDK